jgi:hypothetical protein
LATALLPPDLRLPLLRETAKQPPSAEMILAMRRELLRVNSLMKANLLVMRPAGWPPSPRLQRLRRPPLLVLQEKDWEFVS